MNKWESLLGVMSAQHQFLTLSHEEDKLIVYEKGPALFVLNFHTSKSFEHYRIGTFWSTDHIMLFDTDQRILGGHDRLKEGYKQRFVTKRGLWQNRPHSLSLYLPCRTAFVLIAEENITPEIIQLGGIVVPPVKKAQDTSLKT